MAEAFHDALAVKFGWLSWLKNPEVWRVAAMAVVLAGAGGGVAYLLVPPAPPEAKREAPVEIRVGGQALSAKGDALGNAMNWCGATRRATS